MLFRDTSLAVIRHFCGSAGSRLTVARSGPEQCGWSTERARRERSCQTRVYGAVHGFWQVESVELADGPAGCGEVVRGGCLFVWNFSLTRSNVLTERRTVPGLAKRFAGAAQIANKPRRIPFACP